MKKLESLGRSLSKMEQKKIMGGSYEEAGTRCVVYCCDSGNNCGSGTELPGVSSCTSNEQCQTIAAEGGATCPSGYYIAGLCKG